jgi:hypothetical protein
MENKMIFKKHGTILLLILFLVNCSKFLYNGITQYSEINNFYFFPKGSFSDSIIANKENDMDKFHRDWYSTHLKSMKEPSFSILEQKIESAYRFLWLRSFHHPIAVRIEKIGDQIILHAVELDGYGGYKPGKIKKFIEKIISLDDYQKHCELLAEIDFWNMNTILSNINLDGTITINADGAHWILEGSSNGKYHVVDRWSPEPGKYREACLFFLKLAGFKIQADEIY